MASTRELGRPGKPTPNFANGTTIDGDRLDIAMEDLVFSINNIPARWLRRRFSHTQFIQRLMPVPYGNTLTQDCPPFLLARNVASQVLGTAPAIGIQNEWRLKGTDIPSIPAADFDTRVEGIYAWTSSHYFVKPVILTGLSLRCWQPTDYVWDNDWVYHTDPPPPNNIGGSVNDLFLEVSVDNPFTPEARRLNDIEIHKIRFPVHTEMMAAILTAPTNNLTVPSLTPKADQLWVHLDNLCIPLHRDTRARISIAIPQYGASLGDTSGWQGDGIVTWYPWQSTSWTLTATFLEPLGEV